MSLFFTIIEGNLGKDAEVTIVKGRAVVNFNIAHTFKYTHKNEKKEKTVWIKCVLWKEIGKTDIAKYLKKGIKVTVKGIPYSDSYINTKDQTVTQQLAVLIDSGKEGISIHTFEAKEDLTNTTHNVASVEKDSAADNSDDEDLPF